MSFPGRPLSTSSSAPATDPNTHRTVMLYVDLLLFHWHLLTVMLMTLARSSSLRGQRMTSVLARRDGGTRLLYSFPAFPSTSALASRQYIEVNCYWVHSVLLRLVSYALGIRHVEEGLALFLRPRRYLFTRSNLAVVEVAVFANLATRTNDRIL